MAEVWLHSFAAALPGVRRAHCDDEVRRWVADVLLPAHDVWVADDDGTVVGHSAVCTHQSGILGGDGVCPKHGSVFDIVTGAVLQGPAVSPLPEVAVAVADGKVYIT